MRVLKGSLLTLMIVLAYVGSTFCQEAEKEKSKSEVAAFSAQDGVLLQKEFIDVGIFNKCKVQTVIFTDLLAGSKRTGLRLEYEVKGSYRTDTKIVMLDPEEVDALIESMKIIENQILPSRKTSYTEVAYTSRDGFQAGCFWSDGKWSAFLKLKRFDNDSYVWFKATEIPALLALLEEVRVELRNIG